MISLIYGLKRYSKGNILTLIRNLFLLSDQTFWQKFCENGVIKTNLSSYIMAIIVARASGNLKESHDNKNLIELACSVRIGKILVSFFFFCKVMDLACGLVHKLAKKELDQYSLSTDLTLVQ